MDSEHETARENAPTSRWPAAVYMVRSRETSRDRCTSACERHRGTARGWFPSLHPRAASRAEREDEGRCAGTGEQAALEGRIAALECQVAALSQVANSRVRKYAPTQRTRDFGARNMCLSSTVGAGCVPIDLAWSLEFRNRVVQIV